jgi:GAF domain-containing protein
VALRTVLRVERIGLSPGLKEFIRVASSREIELLRQQNVLARFGETALKFTDLDEILQQACSLVREALGSDLAKVVELQDDGVSLLVRAGVGWPSGIVGSVTVKAEEGSSEGYALLTGQPAISTDIDVEQRVQLSEVPEGCRRQGAGQRAHHWTTGKAALRYSAGG